MPNIKDIGTIEWYATPHFTLERQRQQAFHNQMDNIDFAMSEGTSCAPGVIDTIAAAQDAQQSNLLALTVRIRLNKPIELKEIPATAERKREFFCGVKGYPIAIWSHTKDTVWDSAQQTHPIFAIIHELARHTGQKVEVCASIAIGCNIGEDFRGYLLLTFYSNSDIRKPSNYLHALANKMEKWARPLRSVILDEYTREKVQSTIGDLELTLASAKEFLRMVEEREARGEKASTEMAAVIDEMSRLRHPDAPAGPDNDVLKIQTLFQRGQVVLDQMSGRV